jgi:hypothetical protein
VSGFVPQLFDRRNRLFLHGLGPSRLRKIPTDQDTDANPKQGRQHFFSSDKPNEGLPLFDGHGFGQIPRLVDVRAL